jgi:hypothetical protein
MNVGWQPAETAPEDGREFWYIARGKVRLGQLGSEMGGSIKRDPHMTFWHEKQPGDDTPPDTRSMI